jgi:hypothetical protein
MVPKAVSRPEAERHHFVGPYAFAGPHWQTFVLLRGREPPQFVEPVDHHHHLRDRSAALLAGRVIRNRPSRATSKLRPTRVTSNRGLGASATSLPLDDRTVTAIMWVLVR